jgi:hypothetical protein
MSEKKGNLLYKINKLTRGNLEELLVTHGICPLCAENGNLSFLTTRQNETVCTLCGYVPPQYNHVCEVPFGFAGSPMNLLSPGKGLGGTLQEKGTFCVLAHSDAYRDNAEHLPMSAKFIRILTSKLEHPKIMTLMKLGRQRCAEMGFSEHDKRFIGFRNQYGAIVRKVGKSLVIANVRVNMRKVADACLALSFKKSQGETAYIDACARLNVDANVLKDVIKIVEGEKNEHNS